MGGRREVTKVSELHCPADWSSSLGDATSRIAATKVSELHCPAGWSPSHHAVQHEGLVGGQSWQHLLGVPSSPGGTQSQGVPRPRSNQPVVCWAALSSDTFPPVITSDASLTAFRTERVRRQYHAVGVGARFVPHLSPELNISGKEGEMGQLGRDGGTPATQPLSSATSSNSHLSPRQRAAP